ncbi:magnesium transporter CorA family protein [Apilactobacillus apisilvae]|uniref:Magnesium transporter CorA family protein n=1 Tax=Apilactobacillus apisilvae TaxID=2923364 RepID=A0ABY4PH20_9LACO|nr:magnesium transporter CorA family protein [Apilactobacillus apisilvae]UQS85115.1 magnesium transporter CorA family protein [Apilactobacillus apisilvae]
MKKIHNLLDSTWVELVDANTKEVVSTIEDYKLPNILKGYMLDTHEHSRFEYDSVKKYSVLITRALTSGQDENVETSPVISAFTDGVIITKSDSRYRVKQQSNCTKFDVIFSILERINKPYMNKLDQVNEDVENLQKLRKSVHNKQLNEIAILKNDLVYLKSSTAANIMAINQLQKSSDNFVVPITFNNHQDQHIDDVTVEYSECKYMFDVNYEIVSQIEDTYSNIINNNLNETTKILTIWSLILAIPPIISGFYGMNVVLPFANSKWSWIFTVVITLAIIYWMIRYLRRHHDL